MDALGGRVLIAVVNKPGDLFYDAHVAVRQVLVAVDQPGGRPVVQVNTRRTSPPPPPASTAAPRPSANTPPRSPPNWTTRRVLIISAKQVPQR